jgi:hypothetical protein
MSFNIDKCHIMHHGKNPCKIKVTLGVKDLHSLLKGIFCVQSITFSYIKGFLKYFAQIITIIRQYFRRKKGSLPPRSRSHLEVKD